MSAPRVPVCTRCLRPWSGHLQTCDACRSQQSASRKAKAASRKATPGNPIPVIPLPASINPNVHSDQRRRLNTSSLGDNYAAEALDRAIHLLEDEFEHRESASQDFPPQISASHIRVSIGKYEDEMSAASKTSVCSSCGQLIPTTDIHRINDSSNTIDCLRGRLDNCGRHGNDWQFCSQ
ncbi:hypothetical protein V8E54_000436 [Elaphomyces granulatus]